MKHRIVKNSYYKKLIHILGIDFSGKRKKKFITRLAKAKQRKIDRKEIGDGLNEWNR